MGNDFSSLIVDGVEYDVKDNEARETISGMKLKATLEAETLTLSLEK